MVSWFAPKTAEDRKSPSWWSPKKNPRNAQSIQNNLAHSVKDLILGADHAAHSNARKRAVKALQKPKTAQGIVNVLKAMPDPQAPGGEAAADNNGTPTVVIPLTPLAIFASTHPEPESNKKPSGKKKADSKTVAKSGEAKTASQKLVSTVDKLLETFRPPLHQISAYAFWWGFEIYVPQECMGRLDQAQNVSNSFLGLLQVVGGSTSILHPYFGIISAWVGLQFTLIKSQNVGHGVVLAATWVLPVALVPREWDAPLD